MPTAELDARPATKDNRHTVRFSDAAMQALEELRQLRGETSIGAVIRHAIETELLLAREIQAGRRIYTADTTGGDVRQLMMR